jgi:hypothetical protein
MYTLREWQKKEFDIKDLICSASVSDGSDSWTPFPIGISHHMVPFIQKNKGFVKTNHSQLYHASFLLYTDEVRRKTGLNRRTIDDILKKKGISNFQYSPINYYRSISNAKYVLSPEGNGIDCHRTYEALLAGCVPIVEDNPLIREKYTELPVLYTKDYSDLAEDTLQKKWEMMLDTKYNYSSMFISSYSPEVQTEIKKNGNHWLKKLGVSVVDFYDISYTTCLK